MHYRPALFCLALTLAYPASAVNPAPPQSTPPAPVAAWSFDAPKDDSDPGAGTAASPARLVGQVKLVPGIAGQSLGFDGAHPAYVVVDRPFSDIAAGPFTVSLWIRPTAQPVENYGNCIDTGSSKGFVIRIQSRLQLTLSAGNVWNAVVSPNRFKLGEWTHVAMVSHGDRADFYVDGLLAGSTVYQQPLRFWKDIQVGGHIETITLPDDSKVEAIVKPFTGDLDELKVYDRVLTPAEISAISKRPLSH